MPWRYPKWGGVASCYYTSVSLTPGTELGCSRRSDRDGNPHPRRVHQVYVEAIFGALSVGHGIPRSDHLPYSPKDYIKFCSTDTNISTPLTTYGVQMWICGSNRSKVVDD